MVGFRGAISFSLSREAESDGADGLWDEMITPQVMFAGFLLWGCEQSWLGKYTGMVPKKKNCQP